jgi:hypothetical protein
MRAMNAAFGAAFLIDAAARIVMAYTLPVDTVSILSVLLLVVLLAAVVQIGKAYDRRHSRLARAGAASEAEAGTSAAGKPLRMRSAPPAVKDG